MNLKSVLCLLGTVVCLAIGGYCDKAWGRQTCATAAGVRFCVEMKGPCDLHHLLPTEKTNMKMDMFHISIRNDSNQPVKIVPEYFGAVTADGRAIVLDPPLYQSIEFRTKLKTREIGPKEQMDGFLFFPSPSGNIRILVYLGDSYIEMPLY